MKWRQRPRRRTSTGSSSSLTPLERNDDDQKGIGEGKEDGQHGIEVEQDDCQKGIEVEQDDGQKGMGKDDGQKGKGIGKKGIETTDRQKGTKGKGIGKDAMCRMSNREYAGVDKTCPMCSVQWPFMPKVRVCM